MTAGLPKSNLNELLSLAYPELRLMAEGFLSRGSPDPVLQPTSLVHEVYLRLLRQDGAEWSGRTHCLAVAAMTMRRILIDQARRSSLRRRHNRELRVGPASLFGRGVGQRTNLLALEEALRRLAIDHPRKARVVQLRFYGGLTLDETAEALSTCPRTIERDWRYARAWLFRELSGGATPSAASA